MHLLGEEGPEKDFCLDPCTLLVGRWAGHVGGRVLRVVAGHLYKVLAVGISVYVPMETLSPFMAPATVSIMSMGVAMALIGAAVPVAAVQMMLGASKGRARYLGAMWRAMNAVGATWLAGTIAVANMQAAPPPALALLTGTTIYGMYIAAKTLLRKAHYKEKQQGHRDENL